MGGRLDLPQLPKGSAAREENIRNRPRPSSRGPRDRQTEHSLAGSLQWLVSPILFFFFCVFQTDILVNPILHATIDGPGLLRRERAAEIR